MERVRLKVFGITYSQVQNGAYALVLSQVDGAYRIPIVVGTAEAQSIAIKLEGITPPRPLTHELFITFAHAFGVTLDEVFIYKFEDGIFYSELKFSSYEQQISLDARTSDAIAIAMRTDAPIYCTEEILKITGFIFDEETVEQIEESEILSIVSKNKKVKLENYAISELEKMMRTCVEKEEYEQAAKIKEVITNKRDNKNKSN